MTAISTLDLNGSNERSNDSGTTISLSRPVIVGNRRLWDITKEFRQNAEGSQNVPSHLYWHSIWRNSWTTPTTPRARTEEQFKLHEFLLLGAFVLRSDYPCSTHSKAEGEPLLVYRLIVFSFAYGTACQG